MSRRTYVRFAIMTLLIATLACNTPLGIGEIFQGGSADGGEALGPGVILDPEDLEPGSLFILVVGPDGDPISNARIGEGEFFTDRNGVAVGQVVTTPSGWFPVSAPGYATTTTRAFTHWLDYPLAVAILTPQGPIAALAEASMMSLTVENSRQEQALVDFAAGPSDESQVLFSWSDIPLLQLDSRFGDTSSMGDMELLGAFALEAKVPEGKPMEIEGFREVTLQISWDPDRDEIPMLGSFDPESGSWIPLQEYCQLSEDHQTTCNLPHLSEFGFFGHSSTGSGWEEDDESDDEFSTGFGSAMNDLMGGGTGGSAAGGGTASGGSDEGDDQTSGGGGLPSGLDGLTNSGAGLGTEVDKMTAMLAAGIAMDNGLTNLANQYLDQAREAIKAIAENLLKDPSCGTVYEMFNAASQAWLVGGLDSLGNQLVDRANEIFKRCGVWKGEIHYTFDLQETWPHNKKWKHETGTRTWTEVYSVRIYVDPKTGAIDGELHAYLAFSPATYRLEKKTPCGPTYNDHELKTDPGDGEAHMIFEGIFDGENFSIGELRVDKSKPLTIQHRAWLSRTYADPVAPPPNCPPVTTEEISTQMIAEYTSHLIHGFFGQPEPPNLQEMLSSGSRRTDQSGRVMSISGLRNLSYDVGSNLSPLLPIEKGTVRWNLTRVSEGSQ